MPEAPGIQPVSGLVIPARLKGHVDARENVKENVKCLSRPERRQLWREISKIVKAPVFEVTKRLDHHLKIATDKGVTFFGTVLRDAFVAILKIVDMKVTLLSVISNARLKATDKEPRCKLVDEVETRGKCISHVFAAVLPNKCIVWRHEVRIRSNNVRVKLEGQAIFPI